MFLSPPGSAIPLPISRANLSVSKPLNEPCPYDLVLLAGQEIEGQRFEQAQTLIEAAYAAYDQCSLGS